MGKNRYNTTKNGRWLTVGLCVMVTVILSGVVGYAGYSFWKKYSNDIIEKQKEQMTIVATSLADGLEDTLDQYQTELMRLADYLNVSSSEEEQLKVLSTYSEVEREYLKNLTLSDADDQVLWQLIPMAFTREIQSVDLNSGVAVKIMEEKKGFLYFVFSEKLNDGRSISMTLDIKEYYSKMIAGIQLGTNGYINVKNEEGTLIMHPVDSQWGINVISGRKELYGSLDMDSLENLIHQQVTEESGVSEYYSYWWADESLPRVKKIAAFSRAYIGSEFLIIAAVTDYDDLYIPIAAGSGTLVVTFSIILLILLGAFGFAAYMMVQREHNKEEIEYLKELNAVLEETKREGEVVAHQQRLQIMGTMTAGIAHEFNNILTPIMGYAEMLAQSFREDSLEYDSANEILDACEKAKDIIIQLSGLSRRNMETVYHNVLIKKVLNRSLKMVESVKPDNISLQVDNTFGQEYFLGNETQLNQVLLNICVNAFHAIGKKDGGCVHVTGEVILKENVEKRHTAVLEDVWNEYLCIKISDNGCGMDEEVMQQIFNPFFTTKTGGKGTGLGLVMVEEIIHAHKGHIFVESKVGEGSEFYLYLPFPEQNESEADKNVSKEDSDALKIMVVDDNGKILRLLEKRLKKYASVVDTASNIEEAREKIRENVYDVLLIDQDPSGDGDGDSGICFAMSLSSSYENMIRIVMTDLIKGDVIEAKQRGFIDGYLVKPVSDTLIMEEIHRIREMNQ